MKIKKVGEIPKPPKPEIAKEQVKDDIRNLEIKNSASRNEYFEAAENKNPQIENPDSYSIKLFYIFGGILTFLVTVVFIYFQFISKDKDVKNQNTISNSPENNIQGEVSKELQLKEKELELREQKLNSEIEKIEKDKQKQNSNLNTNILDGYYQVGSVFCTIRTNSNGGTVRWDKGTGVTTLVADDQGEDVIYMEYDSRGVECGYFYFYDGFHIGDYNRKDGKIFKVIKIR